MGIEIIKVTIPSIAGGYTNKYKVDFNDGKTKSEYFYNKNDAEFFVRNLRKKERKKERKQIN